MGVVGGWVAVVAVLIAWPGWVLCWCAAPLMVGRTVLVRAPRHGGACCVGVWPPPMVGRAVLVCAPPLGPPLGRACCVDACPPHGGPCCVGVCPPPPRGGACCVGLWPPSWWGVLHWCVAPLSVGRAVLVPTRRGRGLWFGVSSSVRWVVVAVVLLAWPGLVLCWCVPPPLLGRAVFVRAPPLGRECCVGVFGFRFVVL